ncbi:hypothetical protein Dimus_002477 [Dionaea muscipula]
MGGLGMTSLLRYISFIALLLVLFKSIPCTSDKHELVAGLKPIAQSRKLMAVANQDGSPYVGGVQIKAKGGGHSGGGSRGKVQGNKKNSATVTTAYCTYLLNIVLAAVGYLICFLF